jgi:hypothetical protein
VSSFEIFAHGCRLVFAQSNDLLRQTIISKLNIYQNGVFRPFRFTQFQDVFLRSYTTEGWVSNTECNRPTRSQERANNRKPAKTTQWWASQFVSYSSPRIRFFERLNQEKWKWTQNFSWETERKTTLSTLTGRLGGKI